MIVEDLVVRIFSFKCFSLSFEKRLKGNLALTSFFEQIRLWICAADMPSTNKKIRIFPIYEYDPRVVASFPTYWILIGLIRFSGITYSDETSKKQFLGFRGNWSYLSVYLSSLVLEGDIFKIEFINFRTGKWLVDGSDNSPRHLHQIDLALYTIDGLGTNRTSRFSRPYPY